MIIKSDQTSFTHNGKLVGQLCGNKRKQVQQQLLQKQASVVRHIKMIKGNEDADLLDKGNMQSNYRSDFDKTKFIKYVSLLLLYILILKAARKPVDFNLKKHDFYVV